MFYKDVTYEQQKKTLFSGFPFEAISFDSQVLSDILDWSLLFGGFISVKSNNVLYRNFPLFCLCSSVVNSERGNTLFSSE